MRVIIAFLKKVRYAQCPIPNSQFPIPNSRQYLIFRLKGYIKSLSASLLLSFGFESFLVFGR